MHILQVSPYYPPTWSYGGIPRIVCGLSEALVEQGHQVSVLTTDVLDAKHRHQLPKIRVEHGVRIYTLDNWSNRLAYHQQLFLPQYSRDILDNIATFDVIHLHGHRHLLNNLVLRWTKNTIPYVFTANGTLERYEQKQWLKVFWDRWISGKIPLEADACIAVSDHDLRSHLAWGIAKHKLHTIANGLQLSEFTPKTVCAKNWKQALSSPTHNISNIIVYLGRISPRKGVDHLVRAFQQGNFQDTALVIAGNDMGGLSTAQKLATHPNIHFVGTLSGEERVELLQQADVLVYASQNEIFGLVPFEGILAGVPVIVSDDCGCGEVVSKAGAGLLVQYGNIEDLIAKLRSILYNPSMKRSMVERGRKYIQEHLDFSMIAKQHVAVYEHVLREHRN